MGLELKGGERVVEIGERADDIEVVRALARNILEHADAYSWLMRGFGELIRLNLTPSLSLHVFHPRENKVIEEAHSHGMAFDSTVLCGKIVQRSYTETFEGDAAGRPWKRLQSGLPRSDDGSPPPDAASHVRNAMTVWLIESEIEVCPAGSTYHIPADGVHRAYAQPGTVTLLRWHDDHLIPNAVYWEKDEGRPWIARKNLPWPATVVQFCEVALAIWNDEA